MVFSFWVISASSAPGILAPSSGSASLPGYCHPASEDLASRLPSDSRVTTFVGERFTRVSLFASFGRPELAIAPGL
jgi:hypothetical protein